MRVRYIPLALACGVCLFATPQPPAPMAPQEAAARTDQEAAQIDFVALHLQANNALEALRQLHQQRLALVDTSAH
jgi:hypothetical protein